MKRIVAIYITLIMICCLNGCVNKENGNKNINLEELKTNNVEIDNFISTLSTKFLQENGYSIEKVYPSVTVENFSIKWPEANEEDYFGLVFYMSNENKNEIQTITVSLMCKQYTDEIRQKHDEVKKYVIQAHDSTFTEEDAIKILQSSIQDDFGNTWNEAVYRDIQGYFTIYNSGPLTAELYDIYLYNNSLSELGISYSLKKEDSTGNKIRCDFRNNAKERPYTGVLVTDENDVLKSISLKMDGKYVDTFKKEYLDVMACMCMAFDAALDFDTAKEVLVSLMKEQKNGENKYENNRFEYRFVTTESKDYNIVMTKKR